MALRELDKTWDHGRCPKNIPLPLNLNRAIGIDVVTGAKTFLEGYLIDLQTLTGNKHLSSSSTIQVARANDGFRFPPLKRGA